MPSVQFTNSQQIVIDGEKAVIGSNLQCDIVISDDSRIALEHAVIKSVSGRWMVESLTDGYISVGDGTAVRFCWLKPNDCIHLTPDGPDLVFVVDAAFATADESSDHDSLDNKQSQSGSYSIVNEVRETGTEPQSEPQPTTPQSGSSPTPSEEKPSKTINSSTGIGIGILVVLLMFAAILWNTGNQTINIQVPPYQQTVDNHKIVETEPRRPGDESQIAPPEKTDVTPERAIYSVLIQVANSQEFLRLGTAFAVSDHQLITTGSIAAFIQQNQREFPLVQVHSSILDRNFHVTQSTLLPDFRKALAESTETGKSVGKLRQSIAPEDAETKTQRSEKELNQIIDQIVDLEEQLYQSIELQVFSDIAILEVAEILPATLPLAEKVSSVNSKVTILGASFPYDEATYLSNNPLLPTRMPGHVNRIVSTNKQQPGQRTRFLIESAGNHFTHNWMGSPVLDANDRVVGIYSRPTPSLEPGKPPPTDRCDCPSVTQIQAYLSRGE